MRAAGRLEGGASPAPTTAHQEPSNHGCELERPHPSRGGKDGAPLKAKTLRRDGREVEKAPPLGNWEGWDSSRRGRWKDEEAEISNLKFQMALLTSQEKTRKTGPGFPPYRRRDPPRGTRGRLSDRANPPDFRAGLGEWARKSGCAVLGMTMILLVAWVNGAICGSSYTAGARRAAPLRSDGAVAVGMRGEWCE